MNLYCTCYINELEKLLSAAACFVLWRSEFTSECKPPFIFYKAKRFMTVVKITTDSTVVITTVAVQRFKLGVSYVYAVFCALRYCILPVHRIYAFCMVLTPINCGVGLGLL